MRAEMFWVKHKASGKIYLVYEIINSSPGVKFLVYKDDMWQYESAQVFEPYDPGYKGTGILKKKFLNEGGN